MSTPGSDASATCPQAVNIRLDGEARVFVCTLPAGHRTWHVSEDGIDWQPVLVSDESASRDSGTTAPARTPS